MKIGMLIQFFCRPTSHVHPNDHESESFMLQVTVGTGSRNEIPFTLPILLFHVVQVQFGNFILQQCVSFVGAFAKLRKATVASSCPSVCLSLRMEQLNSHGTDFHGI